MRAEAIFKVVSARSRNPARTEVWMYLDTGAEPTQSRPFANAELHLAVADPELLDAFRIGGRVRMTLELPESEHAPR